MLKNYRRNEEQVLIKVSIEIKIIGKKRKIYMISLQIDILMIFAV